VEWSGEGGGRIRGRDSGSGVGGGSKAEIAGALGDCRTEGGDGGGSGLSGKGLVGSGLQGGNKGGRRKGEDCGGEDPHDERFWLGGGGDKVEESLRGGG